MDAKAKVSGVVIGANKGGLIMAVGHIRGFLPASQLGKVRCCNPPTCRQGTVGFLSTLVLGGQMDFKMQGDASSPHPP